jgi:predicted glycogen debranching enzyme
MIDSSSALPSGIGFGREICGDLPAAEAREWLVTNGLGGYASGTVAGSLTRRYHGVLVAALRPPSERTLLVSKLEEAVEYDGATFSLGVNRWTGDVIDPRGYLHIESFRLEGTTPVWTYAFDDALLEKRIWMEQAAHTTYVHYHLRRARGAVKLRWKVLVNFRDFHASTHAGDWRMDIQPVEGGLRVKAFDGATPFYLLSATAAARPAHVWYRNYLLAAERARGLDDREDHLHAATFHAELRRGEAVTFVASTKPAPNLKGESAWEARLDCERALLEQSAKAHPRLRAWPAWIRQLILAADQFVVERPPAGGRECYSIIAGYPWFGEWGRDTMIALPGLLLATGRNEIAAVVLRTYARFIDRGMLPNRFPDAQESPEYNSVDAALWFFEAVRQYGAATRDTALVRDLFPALAQIIEEYTRGTRFNIHVDPADGLVYAGEPGVQLTWMDAKVGDRVVTPRLGKPVEVNALWYNALVTQAKFAAAVGAPAAPYAHLAARARQGFERFWNPQANCCFDVIDGPAGNDASLRPNQLLAVSLGESPLTAEQQRAIVDLCARELFTSFGLRSLSPRDPQYRGRYAGDVRQRDSAYHQGTVWGWLIGPFLDACLRVAPDPEQALSLLAPFENHLRVHGLGTASEIFDGDAPFSPQGCFAQAWTVAEVLRGWMTIADAKRPSAKLTL